MSSRTLEQKRAKFAFEAIKRAKDEDYFRFVRKLPAMILNNGFGQALAFLLADAGETKRGGKKEKQSRILYDDLSTWLCNDKGKAENTDSKTTVQEHPCRVYEGELMAALMAGDRSQYLQAQNEALKLLVWLKKFADAFFTEEAKQAEEIKGDK